MTLKYSTTTNHHPFFEYEHQHCHYEYNRML